MDTGASRERRKTERKNMGRSFKKSVDTIDDKYLVRLMRRLNGQDISILAFVYSLQLEMP